MAYGNEYTPRRIHNDYFGIDIGLRGKWLLTVITASCAAGFSLVGYDNGVMGGIVGLGEFNKTFHNPDASTIGNIVSLYEIGCFFGALSTFLIGDYLGRRRTILLCSLIMIVGAIIQAASSSVGVMILGRIISGLGMGAINSTVPVLQAETAPAISRGQLVALDLTVLNLGIVIAYWVDYAFGFSSLTGSKVWRIPIALQCVFIVFLMACTLVIPDTPRWLAKKGREAEAIAVLERLHDASIDSPEVQKSFAGIQQALELERAASNTGWSALFVSDRIRTRKRLFLACFIQAAQQLSGINALIYYSGTLFSQSLGFDSNKSALMAGGLNMCLILGSTLSIFLIDRVGRKKLLIPCIAGMSAVMCVQTGLVKKTQSGGDPSYGRAAAGMLFTFEFFFSLGFQATVWLIPSEVLPLLIRTKGSALSTASNWIFNFAVVKFTPSALENIKWKTYIIFAILNACWVPIIYFTLPETKGKALEEIDELFTSDGWHIDTAHAADDTKAAAHRNNDVEYADLDTGSNKGSQKDEHVITSTSDPR
ncbi:probable sugar transporter [Melanopsichium pennsylvanicum]|uniref:Probable sugar transporter n=2 Tax=Melanopsichium pennsylvanicum TaxID=63383 RepID=A0AAJ4XQI7_9BASI|nr:probable sugar transporter [Melanopsichium pennsylvanicum 4]SNX86572.1 probable sugar transporter [Melanopsichium pennsylvanicum]